MELFGDPGQIVAGNDLIYDKSELGGENRGGWLCEMFSVNTGLLR